MNEPQESQQEFENVSKDLLEEDFELSHDLDDIPV